MFQSCKSNRLYLHLLIPTLLGLAIFLLFFGFRPLDPTNIQWWGQENYPLLGWIGWTFYRFAPWHFPHSLNDFYGVGLHSAIVYIDSIVKIFTLALILQIADVSPMWRPLHSLQDDRVEAFRALSSFWYNPHIKEILLTPFINMSNGGEKISLLAAKENCQILWYICQGMILTAQNTLTN